MWRGVANRGEAGLGLLGIAQHKGSVLQDVAGMDAVSIQKGDARFETVLCPSQLFIPLFCLIIFIVLWITQLYFNVAPSRMKEYCLIPLPTKTYIRSALSGPT